MSDNLLKVYQMKRVNFQIKFEKLILKDILTNLFPNSTTFINDDLIEKFPIIQIALDSFQND
jgi:hypothetical protein